MATSGRGERLRDLDLFAENIWVSRDLTPPAGKEIQILKIRTCQLAECLYVVRPYFMKDKIHPKYVESEIRCACGNAIKTRSTKPTMLVGICNVCHPFYTGTQKFIDTAGRVDKFQQRMVKTQAAQAAAAANKKKKK